MIEEKAHRQFRLPTKTLTPSERRVATLRARGFRYDEIARRVGVSRKTVGCHLRSAYEKLGAKGGMHPDHLARRLGVKSGYQLAPYQYQILALLARGWTLEETAGMLRLERSEVQGAWKFLRQKLGLTVDARPIALLLKLQLATAA